MMSFHLRFFGNCLRSIAGLLFVSAVTAFGQSPLQDVPTPITSNEIAGSIKARDVGDPRLTTYYYWFEGSQGDVFVNVLTKNFAGDIDVFIQSGLRPLTKIVVYPDFGEIETGRVIYLRKPEKLLLRIQGKTPNDEPADFRMKFAGSFVAATGTSDVELPKVTSDVTGNVRVNSVGTILEPLPKPVKAVRDVPAKAETETEEQKAAAVAESEPKKEEETAEPRKTTASKKFEVVVTDELPKESVTPSPVKKTAKARQRRARPAPKETAKAVETPTDASVEEKVVEKKTTAKARAKAAEKLAVPGPLANVQLVILFKDGRKIERPLTEVFRFSVDRGVLTVVGKNGRIGRYSMVDVAKVTIE